MFANPKNISIFALRISFNDKVNQRIYQNKHNISVVFSRSYDLVVSGVRSFGKATLSLFSNNIKFFTNYANSSRKFSTREQQYLITNALPSDRAQTTQFTQPTEKKELGKATLLPAIGLFFREFYRYVRCVPAQVVQDFFQSFQYCHYLCTDQRQGIFRQWENFRRGLSASNGGYLPPYAYRCTHQQLNRAFHINY